MIAVYKTCHFQYGLFFLLVFGLYACSPTTNNKTCQQDTECPSGQRCQNSQCKTIDLTCRSDEECSGGKLCIQSKCQFALCQDNRDCQSTEECVGGYCKTKSPENLQEPSPTESSHVDASESSPESNSTDMSPTESTVQEQAPKICQPNRNGELERSELRFDVGTSVIYMEAGSAQNPVTVDLKGTTDNNGLTTWDYSTAYPGETRVVDELLDPQGNWFSNKYPQATYISILDRTLQLFGVFQVTQDALSLLGSASKTANLTQTNYDKPIELFQFPMKVGKKWTAKATASGTLNAVIYRADETYEFEVDAQGKLKTQQGSFDVLRLRVAFTQQQYLPVLYRRTRYSYYFLAECFGIITTIDSKDYETNPLFTSAVRIKSLAR